MWSDLPFDLLANIFSLLSADSLARSSSVCQQWHTCFKTYNLQYMAQHQLAWFLALPTGEGCPCCYLHNPTINRWHVLSIDFLPDPVRPITSIGSLLLLRPTNSTILQLVLCNPFTRQFRYLPMLNVARHNPAVGVMMESKVQNGPFLHFRVYVAGGISDVPSGGATYESTLEMYDSRYDTWEIVGQTPVEFAVRLTVWTPNDSVYTNGVLYWLTSARAYNVIGLDIGSNTWRELSVAMTDRLEFAAIIQRNERLTLVGGVCGGEACVWEHSEDNSWRLIEKVPIELGKRLLGGKRSWTSTKCVGGNGSICLYRELGSGMIVWRKGGELSSKWEWFWADGCCLMRGKQVQKLPIKGVVLHPILAPSGILNK